MDDGRRVTLAGLLLVAAWLYAPLLSAPFVFEDAHNLASVPYWSIPGRGLAIWTWTLVTDPWSAHLLNVALHLVNGVLVFLVASAVASPLAALCGAGVFLLHPLSSEAVAYATGRGELLLTAFSLVAVWLALAWTNRAGWWRLALCGLALVGAALSKEIGLVAGALVVLTLHVWRPSWAPARFVINALCVAAGVAVGMSWDRLASWTISANSVHDWPTFAAYQLTAVWHLLALMVWPVGFSIDHDIVGLSPHWRLAAGLLTVQAVAVTCLAWRRAPLVAWALCWVGLVVAPRFIFATNELTKEYQMYPAMPAIALLVGCALAAIAPVTAPAWRERTV